MISFQKEKDNYMLAKFPFILTFPGLYAPAMPRRVHDGNCPTQAQGLKKLS